MKKQPCRHGRHSWIVSGGSGEWCYVCGAYRGLAKVGDNISAPRTLWVVPTGNPGNNPTEKLLHKVRKLKR